MQKVDTAAVNLAIAEAEAEQYLELTEGSKSKWTNGGSGLLTVGANGSKDLFKSLIIDGKVVNPKGYDILAGDMSEETQQALQLAINDSVLNQLAAGNHTFMLRYTYGDTLTGNLSVKPGAPVVTATNAATGLNLSWKKIPGEITYVIQRSIGNGRGLHASRDGARRDRAASDPARLHGGQHPCAGLYCGKTAQGHAGFPHAPVYPRALVHGARPGPAGDRRGI